MRGRNVLLGLTGIGGLFVLSLGSFDLLDRGTGATPAPVVVLAGGGPARSSPLTEVGSRVDRQATSLAAELEPRRRVTLRDLVPATVGAPRGPASPLEPEWELLRVTTEGPRLDARYDDGAVLYAGRQVQDEAGEWVRQGAWNAWHENGQPWERGAYSNGLEEGSWDWWYENGKPMSAGVFRAGERVGPWSWWYPDGRLMMTGGHDENGLGQGRWTYWHAHGTRAAEGELVDGELSGRWYVWDESGAPDLERGGLFDAGQRVGD